MHNASDSNRYGLLEPFMLSCPNNSDARLRHGLHAGIPYMPRHAKRQRQRQQKQHVGEFRHDGAATAAAPRCCRQPSCTSLTAKKSENSFNRPFVRRSLQSGFCGEARLLQKPVANIAESADLVQSTPLGDRDPAKKRRHQVVISVTRLHQQPVNWPTMR